LLEQRSNPEALEAYVSVLWGVVTIGDERDRRTTTAMEQMRAHLARADSELEAALRFLDPRTDDEAEMALVRAVANARTSVRDALETIRARLGERR
jgi:hypothetical protein